MRSAGVALALVGLVVAVVVSASCAVLGGRRDTTLDPWHVALVGPMSGPAAPMGRAMAEGVRLSLDSLNRRGGIEGREVRLLVYDDRDDPAMARRRAEEVVADGRALAVLGHLSSAATLAAAPVYGTAGIPVVTASATADGVTADNPWVFRAIYSNRRQGALLAAYARGVLEARAAAVLYGPDDYGRSLHEAFGEAFATDGEVRHAWQLDSDPATWDAGLTRMVDELAADPQTQVLLVALAEAPARDAVAAVRRRGLTVTLLGPDTVGTQAFATALRQLPEEQRRPGALSDGLYAAIPVLGDALSAEGQRVATAYRARTGSDPGWLALKYHDAALAVGQAMHALSLPAEPGTPAGGAGLGRREVRERIRQQLAAADSPARAMQGATGPLAFDATRSSMQPVSIGRYQRGVLVAAPIQLLPVANLGRLDLAQELAAGRAIPVGEQPVRRARVVYTGVAINELTNLEARDGTYQVDLYVWFRFAGADDATRIRFENVAPADEPLELGDPVVSDVVDGLQYRLFRVRGTFRGRFDFRDYPFDWQHLTVRFRHPELTRDQLLFVADRLGAAGADTQDGGAVVTGSAGAGGRETRRPAGVWAEVGPTVALAPDANRLQIWHLGEVRAFQDASAVAGALGDPRLFTPGAGLEYSRFNLDVAVRRDAAGFLVKNLLPLALLVVVLYATLYFPYTELGTRVSLAVTAILTAVVLLTAVSGNLPAVGYTVAIEYGFYIFFAMGLACVVLAMTGRQLHARGHQLGMRRLDWVARVGYPMVVVATVLAYVVKY
ncbi:MAG TPA: ABC transporter substrate-binding protein [Chloroflexota bacterium]|nr:ABC transporter substrate-binding protein [Chloroflexota bacterium]